MQTIFKISDGIYRVNLFNPLISIVKSGTFNFKIPGIKSIPDFYFSYKS